MAEPPGTLESTRAMDASSVDISQRRAGVSTVSIRMLAKVRRE